MAVRTISADSHVFEPPDLWQKRVPAKYRAQAPRIEKTEKGDMFICEGYEPQAVTPFGTPFFAGRQMGTRVEETQHGGWDPDARLKEMAVDGVQAEVLYPSLAMRIYSFEDAGMQAACLRAYNEWLADYCAAHPDKLYGVGLIPLIDVEEGIGELKRIHKLGLKGAGIWMDPAEQYTYATDRYDPFWAVVQDLDMPVSMHAFTGKRRDMMTVFLARYTCAIHPIQQSLSDIIFSGVLERFPRLKLISVENDIGWVAHLMLRMDHVYNRKGIRLAPRFKSGLLPSEFMKRNVRATFMVDKAGILTLPAMGSDIPMWASDYPHDDSTWPRSQQIIAELFQGVPEGDRDKVVYGNVAKLYGMGSKA